MKAKLLTYSLLLIFFCQCKSTQSQSVSVDQQVEQIIQLFEKEASFNKDETPFEEFEKINDAIELAVQEIVVSPGFTGENANALSKEINRLTAMQSEDGKLNTISYSTFVHDENIFLASKGQANAQNFVNVFGFSNGTVSINSMQQLEVGSNNYLLIGSTRNMGGRSHPHAFVVQIEGSKIKSCTTCFTNDYLEVTTTRHGGFKKIVYNQETKVLEYPTYLEDEDTGALSFLGMEEMKWNGSKFIIQSEKK